MFCKNCGQEINDNAVICPHCGVQVSQVHTNTQPQDKSNTIAIVGFVMSFFFAVVGLICSIIGYKKAKEEGLDNQGLALAGIIISAIELAGYVIGIISLIALGSCVAASYPGYYY